VLPDSYVVVGGEDDEEEDDEAEFAGVSVTGVKRMKDVCAHPCLVR
jgi:hypothetical protein